VLRPDRISDFECLHSGRCNKELPLYAFDLLSDDGVEMRDETLQFRKLRERSGDGIIYNAYDAGAIGRRLFEHACCWASKASCRQGAYKAGPQPQWIKVKNTKSAATVRVKEGNW
jgi:bifunctional non-homologous end joining protein LigD